MSAKQPYFPGAALIDAYGNGGFRFAGMSHKGSLLMLPSGVYGWHIEAPEALGISDFTQVFAEQGAFDFLILGTGVAQIFPRSPFAKLSKKLDLVWKSWIQVQRAAPIMCF